MKRTIAETLVSFLLGAAWAVVLLGALFLFWSFLPFGIFIAIMAGIVGSLFGLLCVVLLEVAALQFDKYRELKHQTRLLEQISATLNRSDDSSLRHH
ncbi:hypothetical protein [Hydrogenimonas urashimensis]|uniref:hypothetical protein n=1 Tax=Hydrogenimonas urashimensis TaxID=2740515 RepID=UPI0019158B9F|nr:hypothetical protein [Hydrogenimonas urashimensis]